MTEEWIYDKSKTVCFSGHRQEKLPDNGNLRSTKMKAILSMLYYEIYQSIEDGYETFIAGGSRGIDLMAAELVYQFIHQGKKIRLVTAMPHPDFGNNFKGDDLFMRGNALIESELVINVSDKCHEGCYSKRNKFMVDHSSRLIAVVSDWQSGTGQTIRYAQQSGIDTKIIDAAKITEAAESAEDIELIEEKTDIDNFIRLYYKDDTEE